MEGVYAPKPKKEAITRACAKQTAEYNHQQYMKSSVKDAGLEEDFSDFLENCQNEVVKLQGSGDIQVIGFSHEIKKEVELELSEICANLSSSLKSRMKVLPILENSKEAFCSSFLHLKEEELTKKLRMVHDELSPAQKNIFKFPDILCGYLKYTEFTKTSTECKIEVIYHQFYTINKDTELVKPFLQFFEFIHSKSYSEAICETVGSIMKIHSGKGRNLLPFNFRKKST